MKLSCKKIKSHMCLEIFQSRNDTNRRAFWKPKNAKEERKLTKNGTPKSTIPLKNFSAMAEC